MKKIFAAVGLIMALSLAAFGYTPGVTFGADYDLSTGGAGLSSFTRVEAGSDAHNFELNVGASKLLINSERYLWLNAEYFIGYVQSDSLLAGISVGLDVDFEEYAGWVTTVDIDKLDFFIRGEVFDLIPEIWPVFGFYGQLNIETTGSILGLGGLLGGSFKLPW